jgi:ribonuclease III
VTDSQKMLNSYKRLEFLGDSVLDLIVSQYLFKKHLGYPEGKLTDLRKFTSNDNLEEIFESLPNDFRTEILKFKSEYSLENQTSNADAIEAYIGDYFLKNRLEATVKRFEEIFSEYIDRFDPKKDHISMLQVRTQKQQIIPRYDQVGNDEVGTNNVHNFHFRVYIGEDCVGEGFGPSKSKARKAAAEKALEKLGPET